MLEKKHVVLVAVAVAAAVLLASVSVKLFHRKPSAPVRPVAAEVGKPGFDVLP